jgi:uncharacterized protein
MPQYFSPGVYIQEVETGPVPIQGVSTSITGAVGVTVKGPTSGKPILVTSFNDFQTTFGGFLPAQPDDVVATWSDKGNWWQFPLSVKGYFDNGGQQLYVKRVYNIDHAVAASGSLGQGLISEIVSNVKLPATTDTSVTLSLRHLFGIDKNTHKIVTINAGGADLMSTGTTPQQFTVSNYDPVALTVTITPVTTKALSAATDYVEITPPTTTNTTLTFSALDKGFFGNSLYVRVRPMLGATTTVAPNALARTPAFTSKISSVVADWTVTATTAGTAIDPTKAFVIKGHTFTPTGTPTTIVATGVSLAAGFSWNGGTTQITQTIGGGPTVTQTITASVPSNVVITISDPATSLKQNDGVLVGATLVILPEDGVGSTFKVPAGVAPDPSWVKGISVVKLRPARPPGLLIDVADVSQLYSTALLEFDNGTSKEYGVVDTVTGNTVKLLVALTNNYFEGNFVRVIEAEVAVQLNNADGSIAKQELFSRLRLSSASGATYLETYVNQSSKLVSVAVSPNGLWSDTTKKIFGDLTMFPCAPNGGWLQLQHGDDAIGTLSVDDFVGEDGGSGNRTGIQALEDIDDISICVVPGMWSNTIQSALVTFCEQLADRFAILDPPDELTIGEIQAFRAPFDSKYAALYYPWLNVRDPSLKQYVDLAPSAHMAGIYAQTDLNRGVFKAPANVTVAGIFKFAADINQREQDVLNPIGINALRFFPNRGYRVWGARTLSSDTTWKYINVRRIFIFVEKSILVGTQWVVFEPNDEGTWSRVRQSVTNFLTTFWRQGGLQGTTAKEAFFVACDLGVTMTQDDIDNGRLICQIGIAPVKPAEFVIFQIQQYTQDATQSS